MGEDPYTLEYVADWFVRQVKIWNDDDDKLTEWYDGYQKRKARKQK